MDRDEATREAARLTREDPDRGTHAFLAREEAPGAWTVARVRIPGGVRPTATGTSSEARPRPEQPPDPRPGIFRDIPPYGAG